MQPWVWLVSEVAFIPLPMLTRTFWEQATEIPPMRNTEKEWPDGKRRAEREGSVQHARRVSRRGNVLGAANSSRREGLQSTHRTWQLGCHWVTLSESSFRYELGVDVSCRAPEQRPGGVNAVIQESQLQGTVEESRGGTALEIMKRQPLTYRGPPSPAPGCGFKRSCVFITSLFFLKKLPLPPEKCKSFRSHKTWIRSRDGELGGKTELRRQ